MQALERIDELIEPVLRAAGIPGATIAVVANAETVLAKGYGHRDLEARLPMIAETVYPIASTSKAINATLLGMLVDEGLLAWDAPVQDYLPRFRLNDRWISTQVTLRDLITMRAGLPRHDWCYTENPITRAELVDRLPHLELSARFRERVQYSNVSVTLAGHLAEVVTGQSWETLVRGKIFEPLGMFSTFFSRADCANVTQAYCENGERELRPARRLVQDVSAPSGGAIYSTVQDMARWMVFNLNGGQANGRSLIRPRTLEEIHGPQMVLVTDAAARKPNARYALGWSVDAYRGFVRISHGGYRDDVNSEVALFPKGGIGVVSFVNCGPSMLALLLNELVCDLVLGVEAAETPEQRLTKYQQRYEQQIAETHRRLVCAPRVLGTSPSHALEHYPGTYLHPAYGKIEIGASGNELIFRRHNLVLPLAHRHYDAWGFRDNDLFGVHLSHPFDGAGRVLFETAADGKIAALSIPLEPAVAHIQFKKFS